VNCSHSPTVQFLEEYLKRWCRTNHNDTRNPPSVEITAEQSPWGLGMVYDRLILTTQDSRYIKQYTVNVCIVLALVEGVLGYEPVAAHPNQWSYRRDAPWKK